MTEDAIRLVLEHSVPHGEPISAGLPPRIGEIKITIAA